MARALLTLAQPPMNSGLETALRRDGRRAVRGVAWLVVLLATLGCSREPPAAEAGALEGAAVLATTRRVTTTLIELRTGGERLLTTPEHPFARSTGFVPAGQLKVGDVIRTAGGSTRVLSLRALQVAPTEVYNLTVDKTHAYFAGRDQLLVHNVDCGAPEPSRAELAEERRQRERAQRHAEEVERDARQQRIRRLVEAHKRRMNRLTLNDSRPDTPNCAYCTMAALADAKKLSDFLREHGFDDRHGRPDLELQRLLNVLGLTHVGAETPTMFRRFDLADRWERLLRGGVDRHQLGGRRYQSQVPEPHALEYMRSLPGNTNMVVYRWVERWEDPPGSGRYKVDTMAHALTSVRREDAAIVYVDFQDVPPAVYERLPKTTYDVVVFPTDVDWRYNRQLYAALRDGVVHPSL